MALTLSVPDRYAYVLLVGMGTCWLTLWQATFTGRCRVKAQISYPQAYAEKAEAEASPDAMKFNCVQRAHVNTMEFIPKILFTLVVGGLKYPTVAASFGAVWLIGRIVYTLGYSTGDPGKRYRGRFNQLGYAGLMLTASWSIGELVYATFSS
ncbi:hypothetical protein JB92DRAFT_1766108 [Gautieria morchelliformis]|nr:hypothetical protein JB92DRAFT_1766108 [Gautieria morchelliformis]